MPIHIYFNNKSSSVINTFTKADGTIDVFFDPSQDDSLGLKNGINQVKLIAECQGLYFPGIYKKSLTVGFANFEIGSQTAETTPIPTEPPITQSQPITPPQSPTDKIPVPNVIGMTFEDAQKTLEDLGFNTTWIDGKSNLELGKIYSQAPSASTLSVPHRTTVVLYRTTEVVTTPPECAQFNLTPEECANYGTHEYEATCNVVNEYGGMTCPCVAKITSSKFLPSSFFLGEEGAKKTDNNTYTRIDTFYKDTTTTTYVFNQNGYIETSVTESTGCGSGMCGCQVNWENTILN